MNKSIHEQAGNALGALLRKRQQELLREETRQLAALLQARHDVLFTKKLKVENQPGSQQ